MFLVRNRSVSVCFNHNSIVYIGKSNRFFCEEVEFNHSNCFLNIFFQCIRKFLKQKEGTVTRPYLKDIDSQKWKRELLSLQERIVLGAEKLCAISGEGVIFCKHMSKHSFLYEFDNECQDVESGDGIRIQLVHRHVLLIRDPVAVLSAWDMVGDVHGNDPTPEELGFISLMTIYSKLQSKTISSDDTNPRVFVLDSDDLAKNPKRSLSDLCERLSISYSDSMLSWNSGEHECDGPWAKVSLSVLSLSFIWHQQY